MDDPELAKAIEYAQKLLNAAMDVVGVAPEHVELNPDDWAQGPKVVGLTILCRSISNFRAALLLVQDEHQKLEARVLVRLLYENHLWLAALRERGPEFVQDMHKDERYYLEALSELALMINSTQGGDVTGPDALKIRNLIKDLGPKFPRPKTLDAKKTAAEGGVMAYYEYLRLSLDAVHCSVTALERHRSRELINERIEHVLSVVPQTTPDEVLSTVLHACRALRATASDAYELIGFTTANATLAALETEFVSNGWLER